MDAKPDRRRRTPGETKRLSYERDRVNSYGENDKASRKAIPRFKAASRRAERHGEDAALREAVQRDLRDDDEMQDVEATIAEVRFRGKHPAKRKEPDLPLGLALNQKAGWEKGLSKDAAPRAGKRDAVAKEMGKRIWHRRKAGPESTQGE
jgi:hypothetical protein